MRSARSRVAALLVTAVLAAAGCAGDAPVDDAPTRVELPDHQAGRAAAWVLEVLDADHPARLTEDDLDRFAPSFLDAVAPAELEVILGQLRDAGPWTPTAVEGTETELSVRLTGTAELQMSVVVENDRIIGLWFGEAPPPRDAAGSWQELLDEVGALDGETSLYVARVTDGQCRPVDGLPVGSAAGDQLPIGSMIKLYVLAAVVEAVAAGDLTWDADLVVTDAARSLPSGVLQDEPHGTVVSVREAAELMISISDNTATDLLIDAVGRDRVADALVDLGMADPARNVPIMTTRELFHLAWGDPQARQTWRDADAAQRRTLIGTVPPGPPVLNPASMDPVWAFGLDWFTTGEDLCAAHVGLQELAGTPAGEPVREILAVNPGVQLDPGQWSYVAYKGGSAPATMGGSWYAEADGGAVVVVFQAAATTADRAVDPSIMVGIAGDAFRLVP